MSEQLDRAENSPVPTRRALAIGAPWRGVRNHPVTSAFFVVSAIVAGVAMLVVFAPPKMSARVVFQVSAHPHALLKPVSDDNTDFHLYCQAQAALVKNRQVLNGALNQPGIAGLGLMKNQTDQTTWLEKNLKIEFTPSPEFMQVSLSGDEGDDLKAIMDAIKTVYIKEVLSKDSMQRLARLRQLEEVQRKYTLSLDEYRKKLSAIAEDLGSTDPANLALQRKFAEDRLATAQRELLQIESEMRRAIIEAKQLDEKLKKPDLTEISQELIDAAIKSDPGYVQLAASQIELEESIKKLKSLLGAGTRPNVLAIREEELAKVSKNRADYADSIRGAVITRLNESPLDANKRLQMKLRDRIAMLNDLKQAIEADISKCALSLRRSSIGQSDLDAIRRDMNRLEHTCDSVQEEIENLKPELDAPSRVTVWEEPVVVPGTEGSSRLIYSLIAFGGIVIVGVAVVTILEISRALT